MNTTARLALNDGSREAAIPIASSSPSILRRFRFGILIRMKLHTYLNYGGNCEQAFRFYEEHLGGKILMMMKHGQQPDTGEAAADTAKGILYARLSIGETDLMGSDVPAERFQPMRSAYLSLTVGTIEEAERIYTLLSDGGEVFMPIAETFFAFRFAMLRDKFGTSWMIVNERPRP
jgi:PhnB protein